MVGKSFGRLVALARAGSTPAGLAVWTFQCACGRVFDRAGSDVRRAGDAAACATCGYARISENQTVHGESDTPLYEIWCNMRRRCYDPGMTGFDRWGGRGISVCSEWRKDYAVFAAYVRLRLGDRPSKEHSIDRIDNEGNYEPGNIRWATRSEQMRNRRTRKWGKAKIETSRKREID